MPMEPELNPSVLQPMRGRHKIIMGASAGVGKTYRMLQEGQALQRLGIDVVVGYFEPHGRQDTIALLDGLPVVARQKVFHKKQCFEEMDPDAIIARRPQVALVDELAHTNVAGANTEKRYHDVEALLDAGISVISTLNIQHLESLTDLVTRITGVVIHERVPDAFVESADEIVLVDVSAEELQERLRKGKLYPLDKVEQSLNNFFKKGNLIALRELALRAVADSVEDQAKLGIALSADQANGVHERILVCISSHPDSQRLIRRGYRIANRMNGELIVLYVQQEGKKLPSAYRATLDKHRALATALGGRWVETQAAHIVSSIVEVAHQQKVTQLVVGESLKEPNVWLRRLKPSIPYQIFEKTQNIDIYLIASK